jgi:hypothetical protein
MVAVLLFGILAVLGLVAWSRLVRHGGGEA